MVAQHAPPSDAVGYLAIGDSRGRGTYIGHFCTSVAEWRRDNQSIFAAMAEQFSCDRLRQISWHP
jgi:hypothetical protein